jgi:hypothetical protein
MSSIGTVNQDRLGRFVPGNKLGLGNATYRRYAEHRREWMEGSSPEERANVRAKLVGLALAGDMAAIKLYSEMTYGKAEQKIEISGADGESVKVEAKNTLEVVLGVLKSHPEASYAVAEALQHATATPIEAINGPGNGSDATA